jgi:hypothetical protein
MIDSIMYFDIGLCAAGLATLAAVPLVHDRAVRLTTRRLEEAQPSHAEMLADKDLQRAAFALSTRRLEIKLEELRTKQANQLAALGRKTDLINQMRIEADGLRDLLHKLEQACISKTDEAHELRRLAAQQGSALIETTDALEGVCQQLAEEQTTFTNFRECMAAFMREMAAEINEEKDFELRVQQELQHRLSAQSLLLLDSECARKQLQRQLEMAYDAKYTMRTELVELQRWGNDQVEALKRDNARLQGTLHRANGDRTRLAYQLHNVKTLTKDNQAAQPSKLARST